jgi:hypothetical protein
MAFFIDPKHATFSPDTGRLELDMRPHADCRLRFAPWGETLAVQRFQEGVWVAEPEDPCIPFLSAARRRPADDPVRRFIASIPAGMLESGERCGQFELTALRLLRRHQAARDLAAASPNVFWLVAARAAALQPEPAALAEVLGQRKHQVLSWAVGFDARPTQVKFVEKIALPVRGENELALVTDAVSSPAVARHFRHHTRVSSRILQVAMRHHRMRPEVFAAHFYGDATRSEDTLVVEETVRIARDTLRLGRLLQIPSFTRMVTSVRTVEDLHTLHDRWTARANAGRDEATIQELLEKHGHVRFPEPPVAGTEGIVSIRTIEQLLTEGREMGHCVSSYAWKCIDGESFIYKIVAPERATLELRMVGRRPQVVQLRSQGNAAPSEACWLAVHAWLHPRKIVGS